MADQMADFGGAVGTATDDEAMLREIADTITVCDEPYLCEKHAT